MLSFTQFILELRDTDKYSAFTISVLLERYSAFYVLTSICYKNFFGFKHTGPSNVSHSFHTYNYTVKALIFYGFVCDISIYMNYISVFFYIVEQFSKHRQHSTFFKVIYNMYMSSGYATKTALAKMLNLISYRFQLQ